MLDLDSWSREASSSLATSQYAIAYLKSRNILQDVLDRYEIGFIKRFYPINGSTEDADKWNQTFCSGKFPSTDRLIFPHHDDNGKVMSFSTRSLSSKYYSHFINDYASFKGAIWGWKPAIESVYSSRSVIITEGIFDLLSVAHFRKDVLCTLTRTFTDGQFRRISRFVDQVVMAFDMDEPGRKGCEYWAERFDKAGKRVKILEYPHKDLNEWWLADPANMIAALRL